METNEQVKKNKIVVIGHIGCSICYLNIPVPQAIQRYIKENGDDGASVKEFEFDDQFDCYSVSPPTYRGNWESLGKYKEYNLQGELTYDGTR